MLTMALAIGGVGLAMGLIGLGVMLGKRTPLRRSCRADPTAREPGKGGEPCDRCSCENEVAAGVDSHRSSL